MARERYKPSPKEKIPDDVPPFYSLLLLLLSYKYSRLGDLGQELGGEVRRSSERHHHLRTDLQQQQRNADLSEDEREGIRGFGGRTSVCGEEEGIVWIISR